MRKTISSYKDYTGTYIEKIKMKNEDPAIGSLLLEVVNEDGSIASVTKSENYIHPRITMYLLNRGMNDQLLSFTGITSNESPHNAHYVTGSNKPGYFETLTGYLLNMILALSPHAENPNMDDSILEARVSAKARLFRDPAVVSSGSFFTSLPEGSYNLSLSTVQEGKITVVVDFKAGYIEFDTVYLSNQTYKNTLSQVSNLRGTHPLKDTYRVRNIRSESSSPMSSSYCRGGKYRFYAKDRLAVLVSSGNGFTIADFSISPNDNLFYPTETTLLNQVVITTAKMFPEGATNTLYGSHCFAGVSSQGKYIVVNNLTTYNNSNGNRTSYILVISADGSVTYFPILRSSLGVLKMADCVLLGDNLYILTANRSRSNAVGTITNNLVIDLVLCKYDLAGNLLEETILLPGISCSSESVVESTISSYYLVPYQRNNSLLFGIKNSSTSSVPTPVREIILDTGESRDTDIYVSLSEDNTGTFSYNPHNNKFYRGESVGSSISDPAGTGGYIHTLLNIYPVSPGAITAKCKLPNKVVKDESQDLRITYSIEIGNINNN